MAFKRKRVYAPRRTVKRRMNGKFSRRRRFTSRRNRVNVTSGQLGNWTNNGFRTRRIGRSQWRHLLWNDTLFKQHWRSLGSSASTQTTDLNPDVVTIVVLQALPDSFWTVAGGTQPADTGVVPPGFSGDIILRGGKSVISFTNPGNNDTGDAIRLRLWMVWTTRNPPAVGTVFPVSSVHGWDPSMIADFAVFGKVIGEREMFLLPGSKPMEVTYRYKPRKVDQAIHNVGGEQLYWVFAIDGMNTGADSIILQASHSLSFSGDAF